MDNFGCGIAMNFGFGIRPLAIVAVSVFALGVASAQNAPPSGPTAAGSASPATATTPSPTAPVPPAPATTTPPAPAGGRSANANSNDDQWTTKDITTILAGLGALLGGLCGSIVAAFAIRSNGNSSRQTTIQKANEAELEALQSKLDNFYGPYLQLSNTNALIASDLKSRQREGAAMRVLLISS